MRVPTDVLYVLGSGSTWGDSELRFSLRSIHRNLRGMGRVFIVGECPAWARGVVHIPASDIHPSGVNADGNIIHKVLTACATGLLSDRFLFINDDHIVLRDMDVASVPNFHKGDMTAYPDSYWGRNYWRGRLKRTRDTLTGRGHTAYHYDCHTPILMEREEFMGIMACYDHATGAGLCMKSLYANTARVQGTRLKGQKVAVYRQHTADELRKLLAEASFLAFNDNALGNGMKEFLRQTFPTPSPYEHMEAAPEPIKNIPKAVQRPISPFLSVTSPSHPREPKPTR